MLFRVVNSGRPNSFFSLERPKTCLAFLSSAYFFKNISIFLITFYFFACSTGSSIKSGSLDLEFDSQSFNNGSLYIARIVTEHKPVQQSFVFQGKKLPVFEPDSGGLILLLPVDLRIAQGDYDLSINMVLDNGSSVQSNRVIKIVFLDRGKEYLTLDPEKVFYPQEIKKRIDEENQKIMQVLTGDGIKQRLWDGSFVCPVRTCSVTSSYGMQRFYNEDKRGFHTGVDLKAAKGDDVFSPATGRVVFIGSHYLLGNIIIVDHGLGVRSLFAHLSEVLVKEGGLVSAGMLIAKSGATGRVTGPHLHWSVSVGGANIDPLGFTEKSSKI